MKHPVLLFFLLLLNLLSLRGFSTHIVGGEMNYRYLGKDNAGNNIYEIRLTAYRDCWTGVPPFDNPASLGIFNSNNQLVGHRLLAFRGLDTVPPVVIDPCLVPPVDVCYETTTYIDTITLPPLAGGYQLAYQRCCRNQSILNIVNPLSTGATYYAHIPSPDVVTINSNPKFKFWPQPFICVNKPFIFDNSAIDYDGDSIVYEICTPFEGATQAVPIPQPPNKPPYQYVVWQTPPYSLGNVLGGVPLTIDPQTGLLTATPNTLGQFVYGICAKEYRNGVLISTTKRDYQVNVVSCPSIVNAYVTPAISCGSNTINFNNGSSGAYSYNWNFGDITTADDTSTQFSPSYTYPDTGKYQVTLIAVGVNANCADTTTITASVLPGFSNSFTYTTPTCSYQANFTSSASSQGTGTPNSWKWDFGDGTSSAINNPSHTFPGPGPFNVSLITGTSGGCKDTAYATISFQQLPSVFAGADAIICSGDSIQIGSTVDPTYIYHWSPSNLVSDSSITMPFAFPVKDTTYMLTVTDTNGCQAKDSVMVNVAFSTLTIVDTVKICLGGKINLNPSGNPNYTYAWSPSAGLDDSTAVNPVANPFSTTTYTTFISTKSTDGDTCFINKSVTVFVSTDTVNINAGPDTTVCKSVILTPAYSGNISSFTWSTNPGFTDTLNTGGNPVYNANPASSPVTYYVKAANSYCSDVDTVIVSLNPASIAPGPDTESCVKGQFTLSVINLDPSDPVTYNWTPAGEIISGQNTANPVVSPSVSSTYFVTATNTTGCTDTAHVSMIIFIPPVVNATTDRDTIIEGESTALHATKGQGYIYNWDPSINLNNDTLSDVSASPGTTTTYTVTVTDSAGCTATSEVTVHVRKKPVCGEPDIFVPNAFSPNDDNRNDKLFVRGNNITELYFAVYDRWGEKMFETTDRYVGWDGTYGGEKCDPAVFVYYLKALCKEGETYFQKGNVTILR